KLGGSVLASFREHPLGEGDAHHLRPREPPSDDESRGAGAGPEVEHPARLRLDRRERLPERGGRPGPPPRLPLGSQAGQLPPHQPAEAAPKPRPRDHGVRRQPGEAAAEALFEVREAHGVRRWIRTSSVAFAPNRSAALPPLIAIAMFPNESS